MILIDTHCHLDILDNPEQKFQTANKAGVHKIIIPSVNAKSLSKIKMLSKQFDNIYYAVGIYPTEIENLTENDLNLHIQEIEDELSQKPDKLVAIGECGLDFSFPEIETQDITILKTKQINLFQTHIKWAQKYHLPMIIHNRKANNDIFNIVSQLPKLTGVFHCFCQRKSFAKQIIKQTSFYFGLGGLITTDQGLAETVKEIPMERIVLETDSPYLVPKETKTKYSINEPALMVYTAHKLAQIKNIIYEEVVKLTTQNTKKLFNI